MALNIPNEIKNEVEEFQKYLSECKANNAKPSSADMYQMEIDSGLRFCLRENIITDKEYKELRQYCLWDILYEYEDVEID